MRTKTPTLRVIGLAIILCFLVGNSFLHGQTPFGTEIKNVASGQYLDASGFEYSVESQEVKTVVSPAYKLNIFKNVDASVLLPADTVEYVIFIRNTGNVIASNFSVIDTLADELNFISSQPSASMNGQILSWNNLSLSPGASYSFTVTCRVAPGTASETIIENTAFYETPDKVKDRSETTIVVIGSKSAIKIDKFVNQSLARPGESLNYTIQIRNLGNAPAYNVVLYDDLPYQLQFVSATGEKQLQSGIVHWSLGDIYPGDFIERNVTATINRDVQAGVSITNLATVTSGGESKYASASVLVSALDGEPELSLEHRMQEFAAPVDTLSYYLVYKNSGTASATGLELTENLAFEFNYISAEGSPVYDALNHQLVWDLPELLKNTQDSVEVKVSVRKGTSDGRVLHNQARITCLEGKAALSEAYVQVKTPILSLKKTAENNRVQAGEILDYQIIYKNTGSGIARNVAIYDTLSSNVDLVSASGTYHYYAQEHIVKWLLGDLDAQMTSSYMLELSVRVHSPMVNGTILENSASILSYEGVTAKDTANVIIESSPILLLEQTAPTSAFLGDTLRYTFQYSNTGNSIATASAILDTLSPYLEFISANGAYNYDPNNHCVTWILGNLSPKASGEVFMDLRVKSEHLGLKKITNSAMIKSNESLESSNPVTTQIHSYILEISANPDSIIGNGEEYTDLLAKFFDISGKPAPDGTEITFSTNYGSFVGSNTVLTLDGFADVRLRSSIINREYVPVLVKAQIATIDGGQIEDSSNVTFCARRVSGYVRDEEGAPLPNAIVLLIQNGMVIGTTISDENGFYTVALFSAGDYIVRVQFNDKFGDSHTIDQSVRATDIGSGQVNDIITTAAVSGRIVDKYNGQPIRQAGIKIVIRESETSGLAKTAGTSFADSTFTDTSGFWYFSDLDLGDYELEAKFEHQEYYHSGTTEVELDTPGEHVVNTDIYNNAILFKVYKKVNKSMVVYGDSLRYSIYFESLDHEITDSIYLVDQLPEEVRYLPGSFINGLGMRFDRYDEINNRVYFWRIGLHADHPDSINFEVEVNQSIEKEITNYAWIYTKDDTAYTQNDNRSRATSQIITPFLLMKKTVNKQIAETGDILTYTLSIENKSENLSLSDIIVTDKLPLGFKYKEDRSNLDGELIADPNTFMQDGQEVLVWNLGGSIASGEVKTLKYRTVVGLNSRFGENENIASARGTFINGDIVYSNFANAKVVLRPSMMQGYGLIFGKVFFDKNGNNIHDNDEDTFKGVEIITEDGSRVLTDEFGKYSIPNIRTGDHVLKINSATLPKNTEIVLSSSDFLGDASSRLVKLTPSGIAKANFVLGGSNYESKVKTPAVKGEPIRKIEKKKAELNISQHTLTPSLKMLNYEPWSTRLVLEYNNKSKNYRFENSEDLRRIINFLQWQDDVTLMIEEQSIETQLQMNGAQNANTVKQSCPLDVISGYLQTQGIEKRRIKIKYAKTDVSNTEKCVAKITFFPSKEVPSEDYRIDMALDFNYKGSILLKDLKFYTMFPQGFNLAASSVRLDKSEFGGRKVNERTVSWELGDFNTDVQHELSFKLLPYNLGLIASNSSIISMLEYKTDKDKMVQTPLMMNTISSEVTNLLFKEILDGEKFDFLSPDFKTSRVPILDQFGEYLRWQAKATITIEGYTDNVGSIKVNQVLSQRRAEAIKNYLVENFNISPYRIDVMGYGQAFPIADNTTVAGRAKNCRVEILVNSNTIQTNSNSQLRLNDAIELLIEQ